MQLVCHRRREHRMLILWEWCGEVVVVVDIVYPDIPQTLYGDNRQCLSDLFLDFGMNANLGRGQASSALYAP